MAEIYKLCKNCGNSFYTTQGQLNAGYGVFCSRKCIYEHKTKTKTVVLFCEYCGKEYKRKKSKADRSKYCSWVCKVESQKTAKRECVDCGTKLKSYSAKRCHSCARLHTVKTMDSRVRVIGYITLICDYCGKEYQKKRACYKPKKNKYQYCSLVCEKLHKRKITPHGEKHWNYTNGLTPLYNQIRVLAQYREWRREIFKRDEYTCQDCKEQGYIQAHHIKSVKDILMENNITTSFEAKFCEELWDIDNGITYCPKCHKQVHREERMAC